MKKSFFLLFVLVSIYMYTTTPVISAHTLVTDGSIGMLIHTVPDDDPVAGEPSTIHMEFKDTTNRFSLKACNCALEIYKGDTRIQRNSMQDQSGMNYQRVVTFPSKDIYQIKVVGTPKVAGAFDDFSLTFDQRVERGSTTAAPHETHGKSKTAPYFWLLWTLLIIVTGIKLGRLQRKRPKTQIKK